MSFVVIFLTDLIIMKPEAFCAFKKACEDYQIIGSALAPNFYGR
jgi:hypothetical protein